MHIFIVLVIILKGIAWLFQCYWGDQEGYRYSNLIPKHNKPIEHKQFAYCMEFYPYVINKIIVLFYMIDRQQQRLIKFYMHVENDGSLWQ